MGSDYPSIRITVRLFTTGLFRMDCGEPSMGGENWSRVAAIPPGNYPHGVNAIIFDPASGEIEQDGVVCTRIVYVTTHGAGVFSLGGRGAELGQISPRIHR